MKKFLALYGAPLEVLQSWTAMSEEDGKKEMEEWMVWMDANSTHIVDPGNPSGKNTRLTAEGAQETSNEICGYTIITANSKEEAFTVLEGNPHLKEKGTYIDVMEIIEM